MVARTGLLCVCVCVCVRGRAGGGVEGRDHSVWFVLCFYFSVSYCVLEFV